jgi:hypothetical protein
VHDGVDETTRRIFFFLRTDKAVVPEKQVSQKKKGSSRVSSSMIEKGDEFVFIARQPAQLHEKSRITARAVLKAGVKQKF